MRGTHEAGMAPRPPQVVFFDDDAISGVGVSPLAVKLRPSKHAFLFGCRITGADSVSEALEGLCVGLSGASDG